MSTLLSRFFADDWGMMSLMSVPISQSADVLADHALNGEFICKTTDGGWLDPDEILSAHPGWKDCSLPTSSRESAVRESARKPQEDPLAKSGVVGAFYHFPSWKPSPRSSRMFTRHRRLTGAMTTSRRTAARAS